MLNQKPQIDSLIASGKFVVREASKGNITAECVSMESAQTQYGEDESNCNNVQVNKNIL